MSTVRIVGGDARGRRLQVPAAGTRPTSARAREALFNRLDTLLDIAGCRLLDLYAGSGAVGLEALSRGADRVRFVESDRRTATLIQANARAIGIEPARFAVDARPVEKAMTSEPAEPFDVVFADPPYALAAAGVDAVLARVTAASWLVPGGVVVVERAARDAEPAWPLWVEPLPAKRYGEGTLWYGRAHG